MSCDASPYSGVSPHTRGWTLSRWCPKRAGLGPRFPRTRGDGPQPRQGVVLLQAEVSPHTRGWTRHARDCHKTFTGFPAHAGMDLVQGQDRLPGAGFPRTRGDGPTGGRVLMVARARQVSPHTRGWTCSNTSVGPGGVARRFPRTRGDGPRRLTSPCSGGADPEVSPHTRGWTHHVAGRLGVGRPWFPRTRGDGPLERQGDHSSTRSVVSPHTRGWTRDSLFGHLDLHGFPAHAGMDPGRSCSAPVPRRFPRTRGDGPRTSTMPTRDRPMRSGFPAHAGMDLPNHDHTPCASAPRVSPHTRGWTPQTPART